MITENLDKLISESDLSSTVKSVLTGYIGRAKAVQEKLSSDKELIATVARVKNVSEVLISTDEVIIYTVTPSGDEWNTKYPFRSIYKKDDRWLSCSIVSPTLDTAFLCYLSRKHIGEGSQFHDFAIKMLDIEVV